MALATNRIRVQQYGDAVVGEQTQVVYDEETGVVGQKKTVVAQVPTEGGGTHGLCCCRASGSGTCGKKLYILLSFAAQLQKAALQPP